MGVHSPPSPARLILPSWPNVRQKADVTTLCTLWSIHPAFCLFLPIHIYRSEEYTRMLLASTNIQHNPGNNQHRLWCLLPLWTRICCSWTSFTQPSASWYRQNSYLHTGRRNILVALFLPFRPARNLDSAQIVPDGVRVYIGIGHCPVFWFWLVSLPNPLSARNSLGADPHPRSSTRRRQVEIIWTRKLSPSSPLE